MANRLTGGASMTRFYWFIPATLSNDSRTLDISAKAPEKKIRDVESGRRNRYSVGVIFLTRKKDDGKPYDSFSLFPPQ